MPTIRDQITADIQAVDDLIAAENTRHADRIAVLQVKRDNLVGKGVSFDQFLDTDVTVLRAEIVKFIAKYGA
jgi:glutaredoxin 2